MSQPSPLIRAFRSGKPDRGACLLYAGICLVAAWVILLPISNFVIQSTMERMHLATPHFAAWAPQQIVPAMYNFENRASVVAADMPVTEFRAKKEYPGAFFNHFPIRSVTWALRDQFSNQGTYAYVRSRYRGRELYTKHHLTRHPDGGWQLALKERAFHVSYD